MIGKGQEEREETKTQEEENEEVPMEASNILKQAGNIDDLLI